MGLNNMKEYKYKINGNEYNVAVEELEGNKANVTVNGKTYEVELDKPAKPAVTKPVARPAAAPAAAAPAAKGGKADEEMAAICMALHEHFGNVHDEESDILTIDGGESSWHMLTHTHSHPYPYN